MRDPYPVLRSLRDGHVAAVPTVLNGFRMWIVTRYDDVKRVLGDRSFEKDFASNIRELVTQNMVWEDRKVTLPRRLRRGVLDRDGADHRRLRGLLTNDFRPDRVARLRPRIEELADTLLDNLPTRGEANLVGQFARPLAATVISELLGVPPDDRHEFPDWESSIFTGTSRGEIEEAGLLMDAFCRRMIALKRAEPGDDLFTCLARAEQEGKLDEDELASTFANLLIGGMEASTPIGSGIALLLTERDELSKLRSNSEPLASGIEEILRYESPFRILAPRFSQNELSLEGVTIPAGELVAVSVAAANRDPRRYRDPDTFDISRRAEGSLSFGHGPHHCIGIHLGRLEASVALERFLGRFPEARLEVPWDALPWRPGAFMRRLESLPVVLG